MIRFRYLVRDKDGLQKSGEEEAPSEDAMVELLQSRGYVVISLTPAKLTEIPTLKQKTIGFGLRFNVSDEDMVLFSRQMATLLDSGVVLLRALEVCSRQVSSHRLVATLQGMRKDIENGLSFSEALERHPRVFSKFWVNLVRTGEASGNLPLVLNQLAKFLEEMTSLKRKAISAMIYPVILATVAILAVFFFTVFIIPVFKGIFDNFQIELPVLTRAVLAISNSLRASLLYIVIGIGLGIWLFSRFAQTEAAKFFLDGLKFKIPVFGRLFRLVAIQRFAASLGTLLESGVPILHALDIVAKSSSNRVVERALGEVREQVRAGKPMAAPLEKSEIFGPMVVQMVNVGEEVGELGKMLKKVSEYFDEQISVFLNGIAAMIEPIVIVAMGVVVGIIVVAMFLPIFQISKLGTGG
jgi:type IV pilus assembly protein PilC